MYKVQFALHPFTTILARFLVHDLIYKIDPSEAAAAKPAATSSPLRSAPTATKRDFEKEEEEELTSDVDQEDPAAASGKAKPGSMALSESEDACSLNSSDMSSVETVAFDAQSSR